MCEGRISGSAFHLNDSLPEEEIPVVIAGPRGGASSPGGSGPAGGAAGKAGQLAGAAGRQLQSRLKERLVQFGY